MEDNFPIRDLTHIIERDAIDILNKQLPREWIIREMTERDYGIDLYIEIVKKDKRVTGDLIALQVKGKEKIDLKPDKTFTFYSIKRSTINYWLNLPVPVFFVVVCLETKKSYWCNIREAHRSNKLIIGTSNTYYTSLSQDRNLDSIIKFQSNYYREKYWPAVENAIENSLMLFTSLGPFILMCKRKQDEEYCSSTIQYMLIQHYGYYNLLTRYILGKKSVQLSEWYDKHLVMQNGVSGLRSATFNFSLIKEIIDYFISDYREAIRQVNLLVLKYHSSYYSQKLPYLHLHLKLRPLAFIESDWYARYYYDEYENDTTNIESKYFEDFTDFDDWDLIDDLNV
ncbi:DUF4365 domain-containing protein [Pontibacter arcticus]|uniref:DUF4365 domain-containing protein n=1 Tax=Pontibacter arcticus TaxID=2080288 RepID=A0A364RIK5_9BACT|nr:DUF4365 domain-containing protein [Pontibacter arcticus]RAU84056.1 hypothetical protein DP923_03110 [Pontibacter arcticus]